MTDRYLLRRQKVTQKVQKENLDAFLVTALPNVRYLTGFTGSNGLVAFLGNRTYFFSDHRYAEQTHQEVKKCTIKIGTGDLFNQLPEVKPLKTKRVRIGFEANNLTVKSLENLKQKLPDALFIPTENIVENIAAIKDSDEISLIKTAVAIADRGFDNILKCIKPGVREREVASELEYMLKADGAEAVAFETIIASGPRTALPHGRAGDRKIQNGDPVILDFGAVYKGYVSDLTRTVVVGKASAQQKKVYNIVLKSQERALCFARAGMSAKKLDSIAREPIKKAGYNKYFQHGLGHGLGLVVHSLPGVNSQSTDQLRAGMVITIEPGIYLPGWGGVRIEDDVLITARGCRVLTTAEKRLIEI